MVFKVFGTRLELARRVHEVCQEARGDQRGDVLRGPPLRVGAVRAQQDRHDPGLMVAGDRLCLAVCGERPIPTLEPCVSMAPPKNAFGLAFGVQTNSLRDVFVRDLEGHTTERESGSSSGT